MKKSIFVLIVVSFLFSAPGAAQGLLKKVTGAMKDEVLGTDKNNAKEAEPLCACADAEQIIGLGGKFQLDYKEMNISSMDDGSLLLQDKMSGNYYIVKNGETTGPVSAGDPRLAGFEHFGDSETIEGMLMRYKEYISKSGEKYIINFGGKSYGPYSQINQFTVTKSKDKFAAIVVENTLVNENEGKKMDEAIKNAKSDQERMDLAMQYSQQNLQKLMEGGGAASITPKMVTNVPNAVTDYTKFMGSTLNGNAKFDEIVFFIYDKISDLQLKPLITLKSEHSGATNIFVNTGNTRYALYNYGSLTFSDGTSLTDLFNPHLIKSGNQVYLAYMYYSPKKNALMQCKIPF